MELSLDNIVSRAMGVDNNLAPFYKSISIWALIVVWGIDVLAAFRTYSHWAAGGRLSAFAMLFGIPTAALALLIYSRIRIQLVNDAASPTYITTLSSISSGLTRMCALTLFLALGVLLRG